MRSARVSFPGAGGVTLAASHDLPARDTPRAHAILAHCFTCHRNYRFIRQIAARLVDAGLGVLRLDFAGLGESEGVFEDTGFTTNVADLIAAAAYLSRVHEPPQVLIGHSLGGAAVLAAARELEEVHAVATINAPRQPAHLLEKLGGAVPEALRTGAAEVSIGGTPRKITAQLVEDLRTTHISLDDFRPALLVLHALEDRIVDRAEGEQIFADAPPPRSFITLPEADHLLSRAEHAHQVADLLRAWLALHLPEAPA